MHHCEESNSEVFRWQKRVFYRTKNFLFLKKFSSLCFLNGSQQHWFFYFQDKISSLSTFMTLQFENGCIQNTCVHLTLPTIERAAGGLLTISAWIQSPGE